MKVFLRCSMLCVFCTASHGKLIECAVHGQVKGMMQLNPLLKGLLMPADCCKTDCPDDDEALKSGVEFVKTSERVMKKPCQCLTQVE